jgi:hypothetical protein
LPSPLGRKRGKKEGGIVDVLVCGFFVAAFSPVLAKTGFFLFPCSFLSRRSVVWGRVQ